MHGSSRILPMLCLLGLAVVPIGRSSADQITGTQRPSLIIPTMYGSDLFGFYCASCHGRDGKGRGPTAPALKVAPPDLTTLTARHGATFPKAWVESFVTGNREPVPPSHGSKEMPVWGPIFRALDPNDTANRIRIENIVGHLEAIQAK